MRYWGGGFRFVGGACVAKNVQKPVCWGYHMKGGRVSAYFWAGGLALAGLLLLAFNFGLLERFEPLAQYIVAGGFAAAGVGFFGSYLSNRSIWWRLIPGWTLLAVAAMVLLSTLPGLNPLLIPATLFLGLAVAFANIYLLNRRENWWAIIPGGFLLVLCFVIALNTVTDNLEILFAILLIGIGLDFLLLSVLGPAEGRWWPLIPGLVLALFGLFLVSGARGFESALLRWWPLLLILLGAGLGWRAARRKSKPEKLSVNVAPGSAAERRSSIDSSARPVRTEEGVLGEYTEPAPGASVEVLSEFDEE